MARAYPRPCIVISRCIEFDPCRYDGSKIPSPLVAHLRSFADCIPVCPEVEIGLGTPRATVRIVRLEGIDHYYSCYRTGCYRRDDRLCQSVF
jgi:uncharacterized protein YbbK (DUF523 family)